MMFGFVLLAGFHVLSCANKFTFTLHEELIVKSNVNGIPSYSANEFISFDLARHRNSTNIQYATSDGVSDLQFAALAALYNQLDGENWLWSGVGRKWDIINNPRPCSKEWQGISCVCFFGQCGITQINLNDTGLRGSIPTEIGDLNYLGLFDIFRNSVSGTIPEEFGKLGLLEYLDFKENSLSGTFPDFIGNFVNLGLLDFANNLLSGTLPELPLKLQYLDVSINNITGGIPTSVGQMNELYFFSMFSTNITGTMPTFLQNTVNLQYLLIGELFNFNTDVEFSHERFDEAKGLEGTIPNWLGNFSNLKYLYIYNVRMTGTIPTSLGNLNTLVALVLGGMRITGSIPTQLGNLSNLLYFSTSNALLTGTLPSELGQLSSSIQIFASQANMHTGTIPNVYFAFNKVVFFFVMGNYLSGTLPQLHNFSSIEHLYLSDNLLSGTIPSEQSLSYIQSLYLSNNGFTGVVPGRIGRGSSSFQRMALSDNFLTGPLPPGDDLTPCTLFDVSHNFLSGSLSSSLGKLSRVQMFSVAFNELTGSFPNTMANMSAAEIFDFSSNRLDGSIPEWICKFSSLVSLDLSGNSLMSGTIPSDIYMLNSTLVFLDLSYTVIQEGLPSGIGALSALQYLSLEHCGVQGTLPSFLGNLSSLRNLKCQHNAFSGFVPTNLSNLRDTLIYLDLSHNLFSGSLPPSFNTLHQLQYIFLQNNKLVGSLAHLVNSTSQEDVIGIDISYNAFQSTIPHQPFQLKKLQTFAAVRNCLGGTIPMEICEAAMLVTLAFDGIGTSDSVGCRNSPISKGVNVYEHLGHISGSIPECVYTLPSLSTLHLSGNGIVGRLPNDITISHTLQDLTLAHNQMTGTIPRQVQARKWKNLDLSFNKFYGSLDSNISEVDSGSSLYLQVNRLSGPIPKSILPADNVSLLDGNLFQCNIYGHREDVPVNDEHVDTYNCANSFEQLSYVWSAPIGVCGLCALVLLMSVYTSTLLREWVTLRYDTFQHYLVKLEEKRGLGNRTSSVYLFKLFMVDWLKACIYATAYNLFILLPSWGILTFYFKTYEYEYTWAISIAYLAGHTPAVVAMTLFSIQLISVQLRSVSNVAKHELRRISNIIAVVHKESFSDIATHWFLLSLLILFNFTVVSGVNILYAIATNNYTKTIVTVSALSLSLFKIVWEHVIRWLFKVILRNLTFQAHPESIKKHSHRNLTVGCAVSLINNILIPILAAAAVSSSCLFFVIADPSPIHSFYESSHCAVESTNVYTCANVIPGSSFSLCSVYSGISYACSGVELIRSVTTFLPSFQYSYHCGSTFIANYAQIYVFKYLLLTFGLPIGSLALIYMESKAQQDSVWHRFIVGLLPKYLSPVRSGWLDMDLHVLFDKQKFIVAAINDTAVLLTFGGVFPPISVVVVMAVSTRVAVMLLALGRMLTHAEERKMPHVRLKLLHECQDVPEIFSSFLWFLLPFAGCFYAFFIFDTLGAEVGWRSAIWAPLLMITLPILLWSCQRLCRVNFIRKGINFLRNMFRSNNSIEVENVEKDVDPADDLACENTAGGVWHEKLTDSVLLKHDRIKDSVRLTEEKEEKKEDIRVAVDTSLP